MNIFERKWIKNVRFELYFGEIVQNMFDNIKKNVKLEKYQRTLAMNRCYHFLLQLKAMAEKTHDKVENLKYKFSRRTSRLIISILKSNIARKQYKRNNV